MGLFISEKSRYLEIILKKVFHITLLITAFISCKKDKTVMGTNVQDQSDVLGAKYSDTITMIAHTIDVDSVRSLNDAIKFIGSNQDPVFGRTDVSLYTKFATDKVGLAFPNANLVSAEIVIAVKSLDFVGDYLCPLNYQVFQMNQNIPATEVTSGIVYGKSYYSTSKNWYNPSNLIGSRTHTFDLINGTLVVRIPLDHTYGSAILNNPQYLVDNTTMQNTYKGFYITTKSTALNPVSAQGVISKLDLENALSGLFLYYQEGEISASKETKVERFKFSGSEVVRFNEFKHDHTSGANNLLVQQLQGDTAKGSQALFLQGLGGVKVKLQIPYLTNFIKDQQISVNQAKIRFKVEQTLTGTDGKYARPPHLALFAMDSVGTEIFTFDQLSSLDFARYDGNYDAPSQEYIFNISREIQAILNGKKKNYGYYLVLANGDPAYAARRDDRGERVVISGHGTTFKPIFELTYTPFTKE